MTKLQSNLRTIYPLMKLSNALAITPPFSFGQQPESSSRSCKLYAGVALIVLSSGYVCNVYAKFNNEVVKNFYSLLNVIDFVAITFLTVACSSTVVVIVLWKSEKFKMMLFTIEEFDSSVRLNCRGYKRRFWTSYIALHTITFSTIFMDSFVWIKTFGFKVYMYYVLKNIMWYQLNMTIFLIVWLAVEIRERFKEVNRSLIRCAKGTNSSFLIPTLLYEYSIVKRKDKPFCIKIPDTLLLRKIKFWYSDFVKVVEEFNSVFGLVLLFAILFNIANIVNFTQVCMIHVVYKKGRTDFEAGFIAISVMWIAVAFLQTMSIAAACEGLTNEASRITSICYTLLSEVPSLPKTEYGVALREELLLLAEQTPASHPKVSAAGFFEVNLGMMGFVVASITSYIIVTVQFM